jgi:poly(A) polymerase
MQSESTEPGAPEPHIIPRPEHTVSRKDVEVEALKVLYRLLHAGYIAYLVGGSVRDLLLGKKPKDFDVVTDARPGELRKLFRNSRIIGRRFRLVQVFFRGGHIVEVSTFRRRSEFEEVQEEAATARDNTFGTPAEDAQRRDLTINGLFYNIADFSLVDYVGGLDDLKARRIRTIGDPAVRYFRDPVRMLRVLRHAARIGFDIESRTWEELLAKRDLIRLCPPARVRDELLKDFHSAAARPFFKLMLESGLFFAIFPAWQGLGEPEEKRLLKLVGRLDLLHQAGLSVSDSLIWAVFLTAYLEQEPIPGDFKELRERFHEHIKEALGGIEFPRQRHDEVSQILALEARVAPFLNKNQPPPARLTRLSLYPEVYRLYRIKQAPEDELLEACRPETGPVPAPQPRRRHPRRRRRGRGRGRGEKKAGGEG